MHYSGESTHLTLSDLENDLILCQQHLETTNSKGTEIERFLTRFLIVHICGEYEKEIKRIVIQRAKQTGDNELASFVERTVEGFRNLKIDSIKGNILRRFSDNCAKTFEAKVKGTESEIRYGNIVTNRNLSAHGDPIHMTFDELIQSHQKAKDVLKAVSDALNP